MNLTSRSSMTTFSCTLWPVRHMRDVSHAKNAMRGRISVKASESILTQEVFCQQYLLQLSILLCISGLHLVIRCFCHALFMTQLPRVYTGMLPSDIKSYDVFHHRHLKNR